MNQYESHPEATDPFFWKRSGLHHPNPANHPDHPDPGSTFTTYIGKRHTCTGAFSELQRLPMTPAAHSTTCSTNNRWQVGGLPELDIQVMARWKFHSIKAEKKKQSGPENGANLCWVSDSNEYVICNQWNAQGKMPTILPCTTILHVFETKG